jgi:hypothetical protein
VTRIRLGADLNLRISPASIRCISDTHDILRSEGSTGIYSTSGETALESKLCEPVDHNIAYSGELNPDHSSL